MPEMLVARYCLAAILLPAALVACVDTTQPPTDSSLLAVTGSPETGQDYHFKNGVVCHKRADYTKFIKTEGAVGFKKIFEASGSFESKWENAKTLSPKFQELEAVFFDTCFEYGQGRLTRTKYDELRDTYEKIRQRILVGELPGISNVVPITQSPKLSAKEFALDITVRNPTPSVIQLDELRLDFYGPRGAAIATVTEVSNTYTVLFDKNGKPVVKPGKGSPEQYEAYAWFPAGCSDRFILKSPIWQTIDAQGVDRFIVNVRFPQHSCLEKAILDRVKVEILYNGSETMKFGPINNGGNRTSELR